MKSLGGSLAGPPSAIASAANRLDVFAAGPGNAVWQWSSNATWTPPAPLPAVPGGIPAEGICAITSGSGRIEVFAAAPGNNPFGPRDTPWWWRWNGTAWSSPTALPSGANLVPVPIAAVASGANSIDVFAAGFGNTPNWWHWNGAGWSNPIQLPAVANLRPVRVAVVSPRPKRLDVFAAGAGNHLWHWWADDSGAPVWQVEDCGGSLPEEGVSAVSWGTDRIDVFAASRGPGHGPDATPLQHWAWNGGQFVGRDELGGNLAPGTVSAVSHAPNRLDVFAISLDGRLARWQWDGNRWNGPDYRGSNLPPGDVSAAVRSPHRVDVFARGADNTLRLWPGGGLEQATTEPWTNWPGNWGPIAVAGRCRPDSLQELVTIVQQAEQLGRAVRAVGSTWSTSDVTVTPDYLIETDQLAGVVTDVLSANAGILNPTGAGLNLVHVEAGIKIAVLNELLDRRELAMKTLGGSTGQSVAGALSTGVHGSDFDRGTLADTVRAIHLVGPGGVQHWIEPAAGITECAPLSAALGIPETNIHYDDEWFNSVVVSMGSMGIIYSLVIEVDPQYDLVHECTHHNWDTMRTRLRARGGADDPFAGYRALQVVVSQFKHNDGTRPCFLTRRRKAPVKSGPLSGGMPGWVYSGLASLLVPSLNGNHNLYPDAVKTVLFQMLKQETKQGYAHTVMSSSDQPPAQGLALEMAFDATNDAYLDFVDDVLQILDTQYQQNHLGWGGWLSLRFQGPSRAYLSPQHQSSLTCTVEFAAATGLTSTRPLLKLLEDAGRAHGGIQHWGMFSDLTAADVARAYPQLDAWLRVRNQLTNNGAIRTFDSAFTARCGLSGAPPRGWLPLGGEFTSGPAVSSWAAGHLDVFARGLDNALWQRTWHDNRWSQNWKQLGVNQVSSDPAAVSWGLNRIDVFVRGTNNALYNKFWNGSVWSDYLPLGGEFTSGPAACSWASGRLDVFACGMDNALWHRAWTGNQWTPGWEQLGNNPVASDPAAVSWGPNRIDVFVRGTNNALYTKFWNGANWSDYVPLGGEFTSGPAACSRGAGRLDVFARGMDNALWHRTFEGGQWSANWKQRATNPISSDPAAVSWGPNRTDVFARGTDNQMYTMSANGSLW